MRSYDVRYLPDAMDNLGEAMEYAKTNCCVAPDEFLSLFVASGISKCFEQGNPKYVAGLSGGELALEVFHHTGKVVEVQKMPPSFSYTEMYWCGWILAYYQWKSGRSFSEILRFLPVDEILKMYLTFHESSEEKFVCAAEEILQRKTTVSKLQEQRKRCGYSQRELSHITGVNLRTLQQYEIRGKDLSKASIETVRTLSCALGCSIEHLLEGSWGEDGK